MRRKANNYLEKLHTALLVARDTRAMKLLSSSHFKVLLTRDSKYSNFSLSLVIVILNFKNRYLSLVNY